MLQVIYGEMIQHRHLLLFDPNMIIQLFHTNVNYNYFEFASLIFQQIKGTAMGAASSPTVANIYMSVTILRTQAKKPLALSRYIDDIFLIWTHTEADLKQILATTLTLLLNTPTIIHPPLSIFLDLTIYKSEFFPFTNTLDTKTFQKPKNLYQYLHYTSCHQRTVYNSIIVGELIRYVKTHQKSISR